jgi:hypothetical protein
MTNREWLRMWAKAPTIKEPEKDFEFVFTAGWLAGYDFYAVDEEGKKLDDQHPDWNEWLDREIDPEVLKKFRSK